MLPDTTATPGATRVAVPVCVTLFPFGPDTFTERLQTPLAQLVDALPLTVLPLGPVTVRDEENCPGPLRVTLVPTEAVRPSGPVIVPA
ncbi:hypothetical protein GWC77_24000 [Paraburkholderia sp. NMBU_R16]|uniref:hypothetical protein n=1 Tax=Paraburkholderia sp. NMBU_R16 TaxID=2698676 RepID=UPI0015647AEB|nr:hypothetical protein [Paraburkholderia sp. NMBU_R16]NRO98973.1 hypothetical protein [Paraburkholderia sp. NMBU_R16]